MRRWLMAIWFLFLARALFYCAALPQWEGYDEWAHFAVIERMAVHSEPLVSRDAPVSRRVAASLELAPVPWECRYFPQPSLTHDAFWRLDPAGRARRESLWRVVPSAAARQDAPGNLAAYEGLQGPLYYWLMTPILLAAPSAHLSTQLFLVRAFSVALVSLVIPLAFLIARSVFRDDSTALACAAIVAVMPEFLSDAARAGNDSIAVLLFTLVIWLSLEILESGLTRASALMLGAALGLGLLAKAYFLTALPPVGALLVWKHRRPRALLIPVLAFAIAGWWYIRNLVTTHTLTGMWESARLPHATLGAQLTQILHIPWSVAIDSILLSHLYFGAWSSLTVRSWMYHLFYALIALAILGLCLIAFRAAREASPNPRPPTPDPRPLLALVAAAFWLGQLYHVIPMYMLWHIPASMGCYLYAIVAAEVVLCVAGLHALSPPPARRFVAPAGVALFALLDLYTIHMVAIPYYTGLIAHRPNGPVAAFHPTAAALSEILPRLAAFKSPLLTEPVLAALWIAYLAATLALPAISFWISRSPQPRPSCTAEASPETAASCPTIPAPPPPTAAH